MTDDDLVLLKELLTRQRVLALGVLVDGRPCVGLLPFAVGPDFSTALVHASGLARHSKGMNEGAPFSALIHSPDRPEADPLQLPRLTLEGTMSVLERGSGGYEEGRELYTTRFPTSVQTFALGDFNLYALHLEKGLLVGGFARARRISVDTLRQLAS